MKVRIRPYKRGSSSARRLAAALDCKVLKFEGSRFRARVSDVLINWGNKSYLHAIAANEPRVFNKPDNIAPHKLAFYQAHERFVPPFTTDKEVALKWVNKSAVMCRTILNGSGGAGIIVASEGSDVVDAKLYVRYIKKMSEFRLHFANKQIIFAQQKKMRDGFEGANFQVRNHENGFVYCHIDIEIPWQIHEICTEFVKDSALDFGAIDVIFNAKSEKAYILEVNTAPGLEGDTTLAAYVDAFQEMINGTEKKT